MKTRKNKAKHGGDFATNMQTQMTSDNSQPAPMASPQVSQPSPAPASPSAPAPAAPPSGKTSNTGIFGNLFGAVEKTAEKTAEKEMGSLASAAVNTSSTEKTRRASPCKSIRDQVLERAVAIDAEITSAQTQLQGLIKLVKADTNNPSGKTGKSDDGFIPNLAALNPFSGGGKRSKRGRRTRVRKQTHKKRAKSRRRR